MEGKYYTKERNVQIVLYLLKAYGIRKVIASPGTTNYTLVASMQQDPFFEMYSSVDERSAAYIACGLAAESGEPVALTCTGATASRNYYPGLTEAYYRKLPIVAITSTQDIARVGQLAEQVIDRSQCAKDLVVCSEHIQYIEGKSDEWDVTIKVNRALQALTRHGGGPVHLNLETRYLSDFSVKELPPARLIRYYDSYSELPTSPQGRIAIVVGAHSPMSTSLTDAIDGFCEATGAVVFCSHISNYKGKYGVSNSLVVAQDEYRSSLLDCDLKVHIGEVTGGDHQIGAVSAPAVWRICEDGEIRDAFHRLTAIFEMPEEQFFVHYAKGNAGQAEAERWLLALRHEYDTIFSQFPEVPFSNIWIAQQTLHRLPEGSVLHLGILNTLRCWNFFQLPQSVTCSSNTGGFGIDGDVSSLIGASLANPNRLYFGIVGDLAFFYDLNSMGNRHVGNNVRIMLINNGRGVEFRNPYHPCYAFGEEADPYMAAAGHYGNQSPQLIHHYATDLGYRYLSASNKEEFAAAIDAFVDPAISESVIFEVFPQVEDEKSALWAAHHIVKDGKSILIKKVAKTAHKVLSQETIERIKKKLR